ncbi:MAG: BamA/TamA family outer membrane protein [Gammaproteobacteria bacterium]|nr:BamA/TamA family outer membrane protein [Gammaproteobacteria bacterium]
MNPARQTCAALILILAAMVSNAQSGHEPSFVGALISGSTHYDSEQLSELYVARLGETLTSDLVDTVITSIEDRYLSDGYFRPAIAFDDRLVLDGIIGIKITESIISSVHIAGRTGPHSDVIDSELVRLRAMASLSRNTILDMVRRLRRLPGLDVSAAIRSKAGQGRQLQLDFDYAPIESSVQASNRGIEELGRNVLFGRVRLNSVLDWNEIIDVYGAASTSYDKYSGFGIAAGKLFGDGSTQLRASAFFSTAEPASISPRTYERSRFQLRASRTMIDAASGWLALSISLQSRELQLTESGLLTRDERSNSVGIGTRFAWRAPSTATYRGDLEIRQGLSGLGTRLDSGSAVPDPRESDFYVVEFDLRRTHRFADRWRFELGLAGQMTDSILPSSERFKIGGEEYGRAYDLGEVSGDRGLAGKVELGRQLFSRRTAAMPLELYSFYDAGTVWPQDYSGSQSAASAGLGLSMRSERLRGYVEVARALTRPTELDGHEPRVFAELQFRF